jgi:flagellar assembly protein FliH
VVAMSLSKEQRFSESELEALDLWGATEQFGKKKLNAIGNVPKQKATLTVEEIEDTQKQAYEEAFAQGKLEGFEKGFKEGESKGFEAGKTEGSKKGYEEKVQLLTEQAAQFSRLMESLAEPFNELDQSVEKELVNLVIEIASQLVRREIKVDPGQIIAVIREAVNALPVAAQKLTLHMHPEDATLVRSSLALDEISPPWEIIEAPLITRGGCKVETQTSSIDSSVENRLAAIVATVLGGEREEDASQ